MRRFLYLFIIVAVIALIILIGYFLRQRAATPPEGATGNLPSAPSQKFSTPTPGTPPPGPAGQAGGSLPQTTFLGQKFGVIAQNKVLSFFIDGQNSAILVQPDGQIVKVVNGEVSVLSSSAVADLREAIFSYDGKRILAAFGSQANPQLSIFDVLNKSWQPLSLNLKSAAWSPKSYEVVYLADKGDVKALTTLDTANPKAKPLELARLHVQDVSLSWPTPNKIIIAEKGSVFSFSSLWKFEVKLKTLTRLAGDELGLESKWSDGAELGLVFKTDISRRGGKLSLVDTAGNALNNLASLTLPSKCTFDIQNAQQTTSTKTATKTATSPLRPSGSEASTVTAPAANKFLYCAVPRDQNKLATKQLPDDYEKRALFTNDDFFRINLNLGAPEAGNIETAFSGSGLALDAADLKIFNQTIFFINRLDQKLYAISLK